MACPGHISEVSVYQPSAPKKILKIVSIVKLILARERMYMISGQYNIGDVASTKKIEDVSKLCIPLIVGWTILLIVERINPQKGK
jgi:hypothetical protein